MKSKSDEWRSRSVSTNFGLILLWQEKKESDDLVESGKSEGEEETRPVKKRKRKGTVSGKLSVLVVWMNAFNFLLKKAVSYNFSYQIQQKDSMSSSLQNHQLQKSSRRNMKKTNFLKRRKNLIGKLRWFLFLLLLVRLIFVFILFEFELKFSYLMNSEGCASAEEA